MTPEERHAAVATYGFTPRQAAFLTLVMLHAGVCLPRHYTAFAGIVFGQKTRDFFARLVERRFATAYPCWRGTGRIFHVHHKGLYRAIGEADNRHRRPTTVARAIERLMALDAVLADRQTTWLATEREKVAHFVDQRGVAPADLPALAFVQRGLQTVRYFPHKLPIGLVSGDQVVLMYVVTDTTGRAFRAFLDAHRTLIHRLHRWTLRIVVPAAWADSEHVHRALVDEFVGAPMRPSVVDEFRWFCQARLARERGTAGVGDGAEAARYATARRAFGAPRFYAGYRNWCQHGDLALHALLSPRLHEVWTRGHGRMDVHVLPHQYQHLVPAAATA